MYEQSLYKVVPDYIKPSVIKQYNRLNKWKYGYNKDHDMVVISKTGKIGEIYEIQNLKIALPLVEDSYSRSKIKEEQYWEQMDFPKEISKIKNTFDWNKQPDVFKEKWYDYIDNEFKYREEGLFFYNNGKPTYITGTHYMYLQWSKIDIGALFEEAAKVIEVQSWFACTWTPEQTPIF